jgi:deoxyribonuclease V
MVHVATQPLAIVDVHYGEHDAAAACVVAREWTDDAPSEQHVTVVPGVEPYEPGAFFKRELPCILRVLSEVQLEYRVIVIDGYVELDEDGTLGLGGHLHAHYRGALAVIGVAKTAYRGSTFAASVFRGESRSPLFVTARGLPLQEAARLVEQMHGSYRIPTLIKYVDGLARAAAGKPPS